MTASSGVVTAEAISRLIPQTDGYAVPEGGRELAVSSVLLPLIPHERSWKILFIRRSSEVTHHKGQIAFPGGRREVEDDSNLATALRETLEELGPHARPTSLLGTLPPVVTHATGFIIFPFVGVLSSTVGLIPQPREVAEMLTIPLDFFLVAGQTSPERFRFGRHIIWGATARIINQFVAYVQGSPGSCG